MSLALDYRVAGYCRRWASRKHCRDPENLAAEGLLGVLQAERRGFPPGVDPLAVAKFSARRNMARRLLADYRDWSRQRDYASTHRTRWTPSAEVMDVRNAVAELSDRWRTAVTMHWIEGYDWSEVGQALDCTENAARSIGRRFLLHMRRSLG